jgi:preprotein translocase subunit SecG
MHHKRCQRHHHRGAFFAGQFIDNYFGTRGIFTVLALVGSFPITLYVIVRIALSNVARAQNLLDSNEDDERGRNRYMKKRYVILGAIFLMILLGSIIAVTKPVLPFIQLPGEKYPGWSCPSWVA